MAVEVCCFRAGELWAATLQNMLRTACQNGTDCLEAQAGPSQTSGTRSSSSSTSDAQPAPSLTLLRPHLGHSLCSEAP